MRAWKEKIVFHWNNGLRFELRQVWDILPLRLLSLWLSGSFILPAFYYFAPKLFLLTSVEMSLCYSVPFYKVAGFQNASPILGRSTQGRGIREG